MRSLLAAQMCHFYLRIALIIYSQGPYFTQHFILVWCTQRGVLHVPGKISWQEPDIEASSLEIRDGSTVGMLWQGKRREPGRPPTSPWHQRTFTYFRPLSTQNIARIAKTVPCACYRQSSLCNLIRKSTILSKLKMGYIQNCTYARELVGSWKTNF